MLYMALPYRSPLDIHIDPESGIIQFILPDDSVTIDTATEITYVSDGDEEVLSIGRTGENAFLNVVMSATAERLGVGVSSPGYEVDVAGDVNVASGSGYLIDGGAATGEYLRGNGTRFVSSSIQAGDLPSGIDAAKIGSGDVSNTEFGYLDGVTSALQTQLDAKLDANTPITGATKTKITYDADGLVTAGADLTASDLPSGIDATKIGGGSVSDTEFGYLDGVTSALQTQLDGKQSLDSTLTALASYNTNGLLAQTAADTFAGRTITGTSNQVSVSNGDGVSGNPTLSLPQNIHSGASPAFTGLTLSGLTSGGVLYAGASGVVTQDPSAFFYDATNDVLKLGNNAVATAWLSGIGASFMGNGGVHIITDATFQYYFYRSDVAGNLRGFIAQSTSFITYRQAVDNGIMQFQTDDNTGAVIENFRIRYNYFVINENASDIDVRIEGTSDANLFTTDAGNNTLSMGVAALSSTKLRIRSNGNTSATRGLLVEDSGGNALFEIRSDGGYRFKGGTVGLAQTGYAITNKSATRAFDCDSADLAVTNDVLGTLIDDLIAKGIIAA